MLRQMKTVFSNWSMPFLSPVFHKYSEIILLLSILYKKKALEYIRFVRDLFSFGSCLVV